MLSFTMFYAVFRHNWMVKVRFLYFATWFYMTGLAAAVWVACKIYTLNSYEIYERIYDVTVNFGLPNVSRMQGFGVIISGLLIMFSIVPFAGIFLPRLVTRSVTFNLLSGVRDSITRLAFWLQKEIRE